MVWDATLFINTAFFHLINCVLLHYSLFFTNRVDRPVERPLPNGEFYFVTVDMIVERGRKISFNQYIRCSYALNETPSTPLYWVWFSVITRTIPGPILIHIHTTQSLDFTLKVLSASLHLDFYNPR